MSEYIVEMLVGEVAHALPPTYDSTALEVSVQEVSLAKDVPGSVAMEVYDSPPDTHYQIGGEDPINNPAILVWYDTQGEGV